LGEGGDFVTIKKTKAPARFMAHILIVDDDLEITGILNQQVASLGHAGVEAHRLDEGLAKAGASAYDIVLLDINLPDGSGIDAMEKFRMSPGNPEIIIITGQVSSENASLALKSGAWDYLAKPFSHNELALHIRQALDYRREKKAIAQEFCSFDSIIGHSPVMMRCREKLALAAQSDAAVLITGETGTGKELFARALHEQSLRAGKNFVVVDCTVLPENLVESILFGHEKGAFTGADKAHKGLIERADGGTLFLDEIGDMPVPVQRSFLRVLQERAFSPVGGDREQTSDFRLIAATHRPLEEMADKGLFRSDLLYRLKTFQIEIPPLRSRTEDIQPIALFYLGRLESRYDTGQKRISDDFIETLAAYPWPGNVRELINALESAFAEAQHETTLYKKHLPVNIRLHQVTAAMQEEKAANAVPETSSAAVVAESAAQSASPNIRSFRAYKKDMEKKYFEELLPLAARDIDKACSLSGLSRSRLYELLRINGLRL